MSKFGIWAALGLVAAAGIAIGGAEALTAARKVDAPAPVDIQDRSLVEAGAYIARTGDCVACHSVPGGKPFAGGLAMQTPVGTIYSSNITPDRKTGIGAYSYADFKNAVQHGIRKDGTPLYPAMPSVLRHHAGRGPARAVRLFHGQRGAGRAAQRGFDHPLAAEHALAHGLVAADVRAKRDFAAPAGADEKRRAAPIWWKARAIAAPAIRRAAWLPGKGAVDGRRRRLPDRRGDRRLARQEPARRGAGSAILEPAEIALFLKTGRTDKVAAFGAMADVVEHSTRHFADADLDAIAAYLKQLPPAPGKLQAFAPKADSTTAALLDGRYGSRGAVIYVEQCVACHRADGQGMPRIFPALAGNSAVFAQNPQSIIQITLEGGRMPANAQDAMAFAMPAFNHLSDQDITDVINFIRGAWTNQAPPIGERDVAHIREFLAGKKPNIVAGGKQ